MRQIEFFDGSQPFKITKPIRLIELFAGIGAQAKALERLGADFEHYRAVEIDRYAVKSYNAIHGTDFEPSDITKITGDDLGIVDTDKYCYIMTYSFPCQDLSLAGKMNGMAKGSGTRSGLLWEVERLLTETKELPQVLLMENVPEVIGQKNIKHFAEWVKFLDELGYVSKWELLNAKDFGVPQNRSRCFMVSVLGDYYYEFPNKRPLEKRLKDVLESKVDEKYYLKDRTVEMFIACTDKQAEKGNGFKFEPTDGGGGALIASLRETGKDRATILLSHQAKKIEKETEVATTLMARDYKGFGNQAMTGVLELPPPPQIPIVEKTKKGYKMATIGDGIDISARAKYHRGTVQKGISQTITTACAVGTIESNERDKT